MAKSNEPTVEELKAKLAAATERATAAEAALSENTSVTAKKVTDPNEYLSDDVAKRYKVVNWTGGHTQVFGSRYGRVNLTTLTVQRAESLILKKFSKLERKS